MIKSEIRSLIRNVLPNSDEFHPNVIDAAIEEVIKQRLWEIFEVDSLALQRFTVPYGVTSAVTVTLNAVTGLYYSLLPASIVPFRDKASGVRRIITRSQGGFKFFPMDAREMDFLYSGSHAATVNNKIGYVVGMTQVTYYNMDATTATTGVRMDIIQTFSSFSDTDTVLLPEFASETDFTDRVRKILGTVTPFEQSDDNAEKVNEDGR